MATFRDLLNQTKAEIREVDTATAEEMRTRPGTVVLDVREPDEYEQGAIPGSLHIARGNLESNIEGRVPDHDTPLVVFCAGGVRSAFAAKTLGELGYTDVVSVQGGFNRWKDEDREWRTPRSLSAEQRNRYQRHLLLPEVGTEGQLKLLDAKVLLLGAGGLGSPGGALPGRRRRRHHRHHRHGRGGRLQPAAPDPPQRRPHRRPQGRLGQEDPHPAQPRRERGDPRRAPRGRQRDGHPQRLRHRGRRHRQLPHPLPGQRRLGEARHPGGARLDLPLRRHGHRVRPPQRSHLPRHGPRAAAGRDGPVVRRGRGARRAARHHRLHPGPRGHQAHPRPRAIRSSAGCSPTTRWSRTSGPTSCRSIRPTRSPTPTATGSWWPSSTVCACRTRCRLPPRFGGFTPHPARSGARHPSAGPASPSTEPAARGRHAGRRRADGQRRGHLRLPRHRQPDAGRDRLRRPERVLGPHVRHRQRHHAAPRAGGGPGRVQPPGPGHRTRPGHSSGRAHRRRVLGGGGRGGARPAPALRPLLRRRQPAAGRPSSSAWWASAPATSPGARSRRTGASPATPASSRSTASPGWPSPPCWPSSAWPPPGRSGWSWPSPRSWGWPPGSSARRA